MKTEKLRAICEWDENGVEEGTGEKKNHSNSQQKRLHSIWKAWAWNDCRLSTRTIFVCLKPMDPKTKSTYNFCSASLSPNSFQWKIFRYFFSFFGICCRFERERRKKRSMCFRRLLDDDWWCTKYSVFYFFSHVCSHLQQFECKYVWAWIMWDRVWESFQANGIRLEIKCETEQLNGIQRVLEHAPNEESKLNNTNNPKTNRAERTRWRILGFGTLLYSRIKCLARKNNEIE